MKSIFKKAISVICTAAVVATCFSSSVFAENVSSVTLVSNLAYEGTAIADSTNNVSRNEAAKATDGKADTNWETLALGDTRTEEDAWIGVEWSAAKTFDKLVVYTHMANLTSSHLTVEVRGANGWQEVTDVSAVSDNLVKPWTWSGPNGSGTVNTSVANNRFIFTFEAQTATAVRVVIKGYTDLRTNNATFRHNMAVREFEVYAAASVEPEEPVAGKNIAPEGTGVVCSHENQIAYLNDGSAASAWMARRSGQSGKDSSILYAFGGIVWTTERTFDSATIYCRDMNVDYVVQVMDAQGSWTTLNASAYSIDKSETWNPGANLIFNDGSENKNCPVHKITFTAPVSAYGVRAYVDVMGSTNFQIFEFEVYEAVAEDLSFAKVEKYEDVNGEYKDMLFVTNIDKEEVAGKTVKATFIITRGGYTDGDTIELDTAWKSVAINSDEITATDLGGTADQYVTGFILRDLLATDTVTVEFSVE